MKIRDAKQSYAAHRHEIWEKREALAKILKEPGGSLPSSFDRVEISKELSLLDAQYDAVDKALMGITAMETKVFGDECNRHQAETQAKMAEEMGKIMEVFRRVSSGAKVPARYPWCLPLLQRNLFGGKEIRQERLSAMHRSTPESQQCLPVYPMRQMRSPLPSAH